MTRIAVRHGSHDSTDIDVVYVFAPKPSRTDCHRFCAESDENRNIMVVKDGVVVECFKGVPDEVNNGVLATYDLHAQSHPNPILRRVERNVPLKVARGMRLILTRLTRTAWRPKVKAALRSHDFQQYRACLGAIDFSELELPVDTWKSLAFQFGQMQGLFDGHEHYTKAEISEQLPELGPLLARSPAHGGAVLNPFRDGLLAATACIRVAVTPPLNRFSTEGAGPAALTRQCHGTVLNLDTERCIILGTAPGDPRS